MVSAEVPFKAASAGVAGCLARLTTYPFETVRKRMDNSYNRNIGTRQMMKDIIRQQGIRGLFVGCGPVISHQLFRSGITLGGYDMIKALTVEYAKENTSGIDVAARLGVGFAVGGTASMAMKNRPEGSAVIKAQTNIGEAIKRYRKSIEIYKLVKGRRPQKDFLWKSAKESFKKIYENGFITMAKVASYDIIKDALILVVKMRDSFPVHFISAIFCGCFTVCTTSPVYSIRNRCQTTYTYGTVWSCIGDMYRSGGLPVFYPSFRTNLLRSILFNIVLWCTYEQLKNIYPILTKCIEEAKSKSQPPETSP